MYDKACLILLFIVISSFRATGQATVAGTIHLEDGDIAVGAIVQLLEAGTASVISYTRSDTSGYWHFKKVDNGRYLIQITYLGYEIWQEELMISEATQYSINAALKPEEQVLQGIEIKTDRLGLVVKGDTLYYDLKVYLDSTEYNLGDILRKLPQLSVDANGGISYKGQRVDVVLTEGKDIFAQMHKQMVEGIKATDIKSVQIIENYKEGLDDIKQNKKDKVALNVQLTDAAKDKILGNVQATTNFYNQYEVQNTVYNAGNKIGYTVLFRSNNVAQSVISPLDLLSIIDFENLKIQGSAKMDDLLPAGFITPVDTRKNQDIFGSARLVAQPQKSITIKSLIYFAGFDRTSEHITLRNYLDNNTIFTGIKQMTTPARLLFSDLRVDYKGNSGLYASIYIPITLNNNEQHQAVASSLNERDFISSFNFYNNTTAFVPTIKLGYMFKNKNSVSVDMRSNIYHNDRTSLVMAQKTLFSTADSMVRQTIITCTKLIGTTLSFQSKINKYITTYNIGLDQSIFNLDLQTDIDPSASWRSFVNSTQCHLEAQMRYENKKIRAVGSLQIAGLKRTYAQRQKHSFILPSGKAGIYYNFTSTHSLLLNAGFNTEPADLHALLQSPQIRDAQTLSFEKLDIGYITTRKYAEISYLNTDPSDKYDVSGTLRYSDQKNGISYQTDIVDDYFINKALLVPKIRLANISFGLGYRLKRLHSKLKLVSGIDRVQTSSSYHNILYPTNLIKIYADASIQISKIGLVLFSPGIRIEQNAQLTPQLNFNSKYQTGKLYLGVQFKNPALFARSNLSYQRQFVQQQRQSIWGLDFEIEYSNSKLPFKINLLGRNILNFRGTPMLLPDFNTSYIGFDQFVTIGGQIMAGVNYVF